jgi:hypothetical protein
MNDETELQVDGQRLVRIPDARRGILRHLGTLVLTRDLLLFVPPDPGAAAELEAAAAADDDESFAELLDALATRVAALPRGTVISRAHPALIPPDADGRVRLMQLGEEDDLLIPADRIRLVQLILGPPRIVPPPPPPIDSVPMFAGTTAPVYAEGGPGGWIGPVSAGLSVLLTWAVLPVVCLISIFVVEEMDDELGAMLFLVGGGALMMAHLGTTVGTVMSFVRRERNRWWGLTAPFMLLFSSAVILVGSLVALDELF